MTRRLSLLLLLLFWPQLRASAHLSVQTNVFLDIELMRDHVALELWIPTFYFPPLEDVTFETPKPYPGAEEKGQAILDFVAEKCPVKIDGKVVPPEMESLEYQRVDQGLHLGLLTDFVHGKLRIQYKFDEMPKQVSFVWGIFVPEPEFGWDTIWDGQGDPQDLQLVFVHNRVPIPVFFSPKEPEFIWHAPLDADAFPSDPVVVDGPSGMVIPVVSLALGFTALVFLIGTMRVPDFLGVRMIVTGALAAGAVFFHSAGQVSVGADTVMEKAEAEQVFEERLRAGFLSPEAEGVAAALRPRMRAEVGQSMIMHDNGGAVATPTEVRIETAELTPKGGNERGFDVLANWRVLGEVDHWGHQHPFAKEFEGRFQLAPVDGEWLITAVEVRSEVRLDPETMEPVMPEAGADLL